ncbi:hypothetical protein QBC32DRAFT_112960 [Pseudoneurospora amorphoporcata]|uniref:Uncharacterized protein n=1 Tax=Pseudoneurospora amorphoporcata TaxID=241081 RepID=A0AAN6SGP5_9PEZI|nr:hypothetical protein QBC32DRAFT_112960 [Pseudoneurospora amorphoporcata]
MDVPFDVWLSRVRMKEKTHRRPTRSRHSSSPSSSASPTSSASSENTIRTPTSDSESTVSSSLHTFITSIPRPKMERSLEPSASGSVGGFYQDRDDNPTANSTYIILHQPTNLALTLVDGKLALHEVPVMFKEGHPLEGKCSWHWECVESCGWLGFRNGASGRYLSTPKNNYPNAFNVDELYHSSQQHLVCIRAEGGCEQGSKTPQQRGYVMHFRNDSQLVKAWLNPCSDVLKAGSNAYMTWKYGQEGTVWRFVKVA